MQSLAAHPEFKSTGVKLASRGDLTAFLMQLAAEVGADAYMLVAILHDQEKTAARIIASNWIHDSIELAGRRLIASLAEEPAAAPGSRPHRLVTAEAPAQPGMTGEDAKLLHVLDHCEIYSLRLNVGRQRYFLLLSATDVDRIDPQALTRAQLTCCYALSQVPGLLSAAMAQAPLSERERECLNWVSEGKTTEEVALILGVSANTVNGYVTHAIQKLAASNRPMAIASAIRSGII